MTTEDPGFWDFSWEEMGTYDIPAIIDFVLAKTGQSQVSYVGHSEGTTQIFAAASLAPAYYKEKMNIFVALGPATFISNCEAKFL